MTVIIVLPLITVKQFQVFFSAFFASIFPVNPSMVRTPLICSGDNTGGAGQSHDGGADSGPVK